MDTSALYALLVRSEREHAAVVAAFEALLLRRRDLVTSNYVLLESSALLQHRIGLDAVHDLDRRIVPLLRVRWIGEDEHRRALARLQKTNRRGVSLVDCTSFVVMDALGIREALTLDDDFAAQGYRPLELPKA